MKYIQRRLDPNRIIYRKYAKNYRHNMNIIIFLKSNYKYKRRTTRCHISRKQQSQWHLPDLQQKHKLPANRETITEDKQFTKKIPFYESIKLDNFLREFILIMQQATQKNKNNNNNNYNNHLNCSKSKSTSSRLATRLVAKININNAKKSLANEDQDGIGENHRAYKDANKDTAVNVDISNIAVEISHQQHNYDKVSTITSTPIKCQRRKHHQVNATNSLVSPSPTPTQSSSFSLMTTTSTMTMTTVLSSPSLANYETCQWSAILRHYVPGNSSIHQHQYHHNSKHTHYYRQHHQALNKNSLTSSRVLHIDNNNNNSSRSNNDSATSMRTRIYQSVDQYVNATWNRSYSLSCLLLTLFIAFGIGVRSTTAGACWQTVLNNGKCNEIFSLNISKSECCGANQEFAYTEREPTNVEYFFATAIGGGMECSPCLESCRNVKCGPNKKCVKRRGRPKCVCAPECGPARRRRKHREHLMQQEQQPQHHTLHLDNGPIIEDDIDEGGGYFSDVPSADRSSNTFNVKIEKSQQSRDTRSLSSEITNVNLGLGNGKDAIVGSGATSQVERHHCKEYNQNQRKLLHVHIHHSHEHGQHYTHQEKHKNQEPRNSRRLLITANVEHTEKPTTRRLQIFSNVRTTHARRQNINNSNKSRNGQHEDADPSDYDKENDKDYNYNDAEDDAKEAKKKNSSNFSNGNSKNHRNDDSKRFLNQSSSRHKPKTNTKPNNNNNSNINSNNNTKNKNKNHHNLQTTKLQQHSSNNNNTRAKHPQLSGRHAENTPHNRHHSHNHHNHQRHQLLQQQQQEQHHNNYQQQSQNNRRHKHNKSNKKLHKQQQSIVLKKPKNNKDYNITTTNTSTSIDVVTTATAARYNNPYNSNTDTTAVGASSTVFPQTRMVKIAAATSLNLSSPSAVNPTTQSQLLLLSSSAKSSFSSATPVNSTMSANDDAAADDYYHSSLPNHGSKIATSSLLSATSNSSFLSLSTPLASSPSPSSTYSQLSVEVSAHSSSESSDVTMSAKGEGVSLHDHKHHNEIPTKTAYNNNNNDNIISVLQSNLHNNQQQDQQQQTQPQSQHHFQTPLFDGISEQFDLIGFSSNKQQQRVTNGDNVRPLNPVCGTDGRTYNTECQLRKRACRTDNPNLQIAYRGHCRTTCNGVKCLNGLTCVEDQYSMPHCIACRIECPQDDYDNDVVDATRAVCGADGKTYKSTCDINRMICKIGRSIGVAYPGPCREDQVTCDDINCGPKQVCLIDLLTHKPRCTSCRYKCSRKRRPSSPHFEEGKICGFNNRTYNSWCEMRKDSCSTGFYIDVKYSGDCH